MHRQSEPQTVSQVSRRFECLRNLPYTTQIINGDCTTLHQATELLISVRVCHACSIPAAPLGFPLEVKTQEIEKIRINNETTKETKIKLEYPEKKKKSLGVVYYLRSAPQSCTTVMGPL